MKPKSMRNNGSYGRCYGFWGDYFTYFWGLGMEPQIYCLEVKDLESSVQWLVA